MDKANELAASFSAKCDLPPVSEDQFVPRPTHVQKDFVAIRSRSVLKILQGLDIKIATGQDGIGARILKELADVLAYPIAVLSRRILYEGCWPDRWRSHLLISIYKKRSVYAAINYRGIHLTTIMSKVVERTIGNPLIAHLQSYGFGDHQWAFRKMSSARDLLTVCVSSWILAICKGCKVGLYLGGITAAFDRVFKDFLWPNWSVQRLPIFFWIS